jgi:hypothetical protein
VTPTPLEILIDMRFRCRVDHGDAAEHRFVLSASILASARGAPEFGLERAAEHGSSLGSPFLSSPARATVIAGGDPDASSN